MDLESDFDDATINSFFDDFSEHESVKAEKIDEAIVSRLSTGNISSIFYEYIIKNNIVGIDKINNETFRKNMAFYANHISNTIKNYKYSPYLEKLISKGRNKIPRITSIPTIKDRIVLVVLKE
jgi:retron-type reverse transcriptase